MSFRGALGIIRLQVATRFAYPFEFWARLVTTPMYVAVFAFLWLTVYQHSPSATIGGLTAGQMVAYYILVEISVQLITMQEVIWQMGKEVRKGRIDVELIKPISYWGGHLAHRLGDKVAFGAIMVVPFFAVAILVFGAPVPDALTLGAYAVVVLLGMLLSFFMCAALAALVVPLGHEFGGMTLLWILEGLLGGIIMPLQLYPGWFQSIAMASPFQYTIYTPAMIWLGRMPVTAQLLMGMLAWTAVSFVIAWTAWRLVLRKMTVQGG